jgi:alkylhydroperoxidase family enzyme
MLDGKPGLLTDPRLNFIAEVTKRLTSMPHKMTTSDLRRLRAEFDFSLVEYFDLINVIGMFAWANRLMQTLGASVDSTLAVTEITVDPGRSTPSP